MHVGGGVGIPAEIGPDDPLAHHAGVFVVGHLQEDGVLVVAQQGDHVAPAEVGAGLLGQAVHDGVQTALGQGLVPVAFHGEDHQLGADAAAADGPGGGLEDGDEEVVVAEEGAFSGVLAQHILIQVVDGDPMVVDVFHGAVVQLPQGLGGHGAQVAEEEVPGLFVGGDGLLPSAQGQQAGEQVVPQDLAEGLVLQGILGQVDDPFVAVLFGQGGQAVSDGGQVAVQVVQLHGLDPVLPGELGQKTGLVEVQSLAVGFGPVLGVLGLVALVAVEVEKLHIHFRRDLGVPEIPLSGAQDVGAVVQLGQLGPQAVEKDPQGVLGVVLAALLAPEQVIELGLGDSPAPVKEQVGQQEPHFAGTGLGAVHADIPPAEAEAIEHFNMNHVGTLLSGQSIK